MTPETNLPPERKRSLLALRAVLALAAGAVVLSRPADTHPSCLPVLGLYLATNLVLLFEKPAAFLRRTPAMLLFLFDLGALTTLMLLGGEIRSQFYVAFFLVILLAGLTKSIRAAWGAAGIAAFVYGMATGVARPEELLEIGFTTRLALFFATAVFAGYLAEESRAEREKSRRLAHQISQERESLRRLQDLNRMLFDEAADGVLLAGPDGLVVDSNPRARELLGRDPRGVTYGKLFGMSDTQIVPALRGPFRAPNRPQEPSLMNLDLRRPDGTTVACEVVHKFFTFEGQTHSLFLLRDVGAVRSLHHRLAGLEKMSVLGQLLGSMAHEINNPLSIILGCAEMIESGAVPPEGLKEYIGHIRQAGERCRRVLNGFLDQYRSRPFIPQNVSLDGLARRTLELMEFHFRYHLVRVESDIAEGVAMRGDPRQIEQVLVNLLMNAVQAMKDQPRRVLSVRVVPDPQGPCLTVADTGCGIPPERQKNLFERGISDKEGGHGLGLSLSREIVSRHRGRIEFTSRPGQTVFTVRFPAPPAP